MVQYKIIKKTDKWSTNRLTREVAHLLKEKEEEGYQIVSVAFGVNLWWMPTAYITLRREVKA